MALIIYAEMPFSELMRMLPRIKYDQALGAHLFSRADTRDLSHIFPFERLSANRFDSFLIRLTRPLPPLLPSLL
jgi:hypothetical protein